MRKIIHIDMDAFYAAVEQRDNPGLRGKPVIVGGLPEGRGGVVATASYEAQEIWCTICNAFQKSTGALPGRHFCSSRFDAYKQVSNHIRAIFHRYTDIIEPLSLDEAFLDVTNDKLQIGSAITIAEEIRKSH